MHKNEECSGVTSLLDELTGLRLHGDSKRPENKNSKMIQKAAS